MSDLPPGFVLGTPQDAPGDLPPGFVTGEKKKFGLGDTWPAKLAKGIYDAVTLPGDVMAGKAHVPGSPDAQAIPGAVPFGSPESSGERIGELATLASPVPQAMRARTLTGALRRDNLPAPTPKMLAESSDAKYDAARNLGVELPASNISGFADRVANHLFEERGITPEQAPHTYRTLDRLRSAPPDASVTVPNLDALRQNFGHTAGNFNNPTDQGAAITAKRYLADHLASLTDQDAIRGPASEIARLTKSANKDYTSLKTDEEIGDALYKAGLETHGTHSGKNLDNKTRQAFVRILTSDKAGAGLRDNERAAAEALVEGSKPADWARTVGKVLGGGGGMGRLHAIMSGGSAGFAVGGPVGAAVGAIGAPTVGHFLSKFAENSTTKRVDALREMVRGRSDLGESMPKTIAGSVSDKKAALARALMLGATPQEQPYRGPNLGPLQ